jgi:nucleotide-binding universal stress UspA family protein
MSKILIATDGSKYSQQAVDYGVGLAKRMGSGVVALYVINLRSLEMFALGHHDDIGGYDRVNSELKREGEHALDYVASKGEEAGVPVEKLLLRGYPVDVILKMAVDRGVEMIVLGNLGRSGLDHLLMGSVSADVVRRAHCPVLVVRGKP